MVQVNRDRYTGLMCSWNPPMSAESYMETRIRVHTDSGRIEETGPAHMPESLGRAGVSLGFGSVQLHAQELLQIEHHN